MTHSWSVLDPLENAAITIQLQQPVTVERLAVWLTISPGLAVAKEVAFEGDGKPLLTATLEAKKGRQELPLPAPATFRELKLTVRSTYPGQNEWGSISESRALTRRARTATVAAPLRAAATRRCPGEIPGNQSGGPRSARVHDSHRQLPPALRQMDRPTTGFAVPGVFSSRRHPRLRHLSDRRLEQTRMDSSGPRSNGLAGKAVGAATAVRLDRNQQRRPMDRASGK